MDTNKQDAHASQEAEQLAKLEGLTKGFYETQAKDLLYHGWHHVLFVRKKTREFAQHLDCDVFLAESAALVHDLNHVVRRQAELKEGTPLRRGLLGECDYSSAQIMRIECMIEEALPVEKNDNISREAKALSDADALYRVLPFTPILFTRAYLQRNGHAIGGLAEDILRTQGQLAQGESYFYTKHAEQFYGEWARANLQTWQLVSDSLNDPDVEEVLSLAKQSKVL